MKKSMEIFIAAIMIVLFLTACQNNSETDQTTTQLFSTASKTTTTTQETTIEATTTAAASEQTTIVDHSEDNALLTRLLPEREGFIWRYNGFAEYGHSAGLDGIAKDGTGSIYFLSGTVDDMSGGESGRDYDIAITYHISEGQLFQYTETSVQMDSEYKKIVLIKPPLEKGMVWTQEATDKDDQTIELKCKIMEVTGDAEKTYTVRYEETDTDYYEERKLRENIGIVSFSRLFVSDDQKFVIGYSLYDEVSGYEALLKLKSLLPPFDKALRYFGLAEYAHIVGWTNTVTGSEKDTFIFEGEFQDGSGIPGDLTVHYILDKKELTVTESVEENTQSGEKKINSIVPEMIILKAPLTAGNSWSQEVTVDGSKYTMQAVITDAKTDPNDNFVISYSVMYVIDGMDDYFQERYIQKRIFKTGRGMISFSQLFPGDIGLSGKDLEDSNKVEQAIANHSFGYSQDLTQ